MSLTPAQHALRMSGLGSSDIGAVAGLSPYARPLDVWLVKRGLVEVPETDAMRLGTALEPVVADLYAREYLALGEYLASPAGVWPDSTDGTLRHVDEPWMLASPDRVVCVEAFSDPLAHASRLVEIKTVSHRQAYHWGEAHDDVPPWYRAQVEWQMLVTGIPRCDLVALIGGAELRVYRLAADPELAEMLAGIARGFWRTVEEGIEPPIDGSESWRAWLESRFPAARGPLLDATTEAHDAARRFREARNRKVAAEADEDLAANELCALIGEADGIRGDTWKATWRAAGKGTPRWKDIAIELGSERYPDLVARHTTAPSRRFTFTSKE